MELMYSSIKTPYQTTMRIRVFRVQSQ